MDSIEHALNRCLPAFTILLPTEGRVGVVVTIDEYPQCRGVGKTVTEALRAARHELNFLRDCRVAWAIESHLEIEVAH